MPLSYIITNVYCWLSFYLVILSPGYTVDHSRNFKSAAVYGIPMKITI